MKDIFPKPVKPPKLVKAYGPTLGYITAGIFIVFALVHMFRIDTLVPTVDDILPGGSKFASLFVIVVIMAEVFALPFLLRIKLSPLAHICSGFLVILAPLLWTLLSIWAFGADTSTGQLGEFIHVSTSWYVIALNFIWLGFSFYTLWTLGYNNIKIKDALKK